MSNTELFTAIHPELPCGTSLEYDPEFAVLQARLQPKAEVQYGPFSAQPEGPDWTDIERDCRRLLLKSIDINLLIWFTRARTRVSGASGLAQGLHALLAALCTWPEQVHPQLVLEGLFDPAVRANALAALCDPEGLLEDVRSVVVTGSTAARLTMRDIERAHAIPRPPYSAEPQAVHRQLAALLHKSDPTLNHLLQAALSAQALAHWIANDPHNQFGDDAPNLLPLLKLFADLRAFEQPSTHTTSDKIQAYAVHDQPRTPLSALALHGEQAHNTPPHSPQPDHLSLPLSTHEQREHIRAMLIQVRQWIELHEPSSPVAVLLKQAQRMWGRRFSEVATLIPPELLQAWDQEVE